MFQLYADKNRLTVQAAETLTSGLVNVYEVQFAFSPEWDGLARTAVFRAGEHSASVLLDGGGRCLLPWEVLLHPGHRLQEGVYGTRGGETVLPTVWAALGEVLRGAEPAQAARAPSPGIYEQVLSALAAKGDGLRLDGAALSLLAGGETLQSVVLPPGGGGGAADHRQLTGCDADSLHPISAVTGLRRELACRPTADDAMTVFDLIGIMEGKSDGEIFG